MACPAQEKNLSDGVDEACTHMYVFESADNMGRLSRFPHHQATGSCPDVTEGRPL